MRFGFLRGRQGEESAPESASPTSAEPARPRFSFFRAVAQKLDQIVGRRGKIDEALFEELEELLIQGDVNIHTTTEIIRVVRTAVQDERLSDADAVTTRLKAELVKLLEAGQGPEARRLKVSAEAPSLYLVVGVNGVGKTTTIAKLAYRFQQQGKRVVLAAGDTFRAAAIDQLEIWAERTGTEVVKHREGSDPAAVVYDSIKAARARGADYIIADTAGRLHTRTNLMEELRKIGRIAERELGRPPEETLLVLDATTGQNGLSQAKQFKAAVPLTGVALVKLDGTARGGIVLTLADELKLPIKLIGVGEKMGDLEDFDPAQFVDGLFS